MCWDLLEPQMTLTAYIFVIRCIYELSYTLHTSHNEVIEVIGVRKDPITPETLEFL